MKYALGNMLNGAGGLNADQLALDLQFAADKTLTARRGPTPTFSRSSSGTFVNANGLIVGKTEGTTSSITPSTQTIGSQVTVTVASGSVVGWVIGQAISLIVDTDGQDDPDATELWLLGNIVSTTSTQLVFEVTSRTTQAGSTSSWTLGYRGPRFDHDPVSPFACRGLLIEEGRTNVSIRSEELGNAAYGTQALLPVSSNVSVSPDGNTSADKIIENTSTAVHRLFTPQFTATSGVTYTASVFAKSDGRRYLYLNAGAPFNAQTTFDLQNGVVSGTAVGTSSITNFGNGWYRCSVTGTASTTTVGVVSLHINNTVSTAFDDSYLGNGVSGLLLWGVQVEAGSFPTSYIPTTTSTAARAADVCSITGAAFSGPNGLYNNAAGTLLSEARIANLVGNNRGIVQIDDNTNSNILRHAYSLSEGGFFSSIRSNSDTPTTLSVITGTASTIQKRVIAYEGTSFASTTNGAAVATATRAMPIGLNGMKIGNLSDGSFYLSGHIAAIRYYKKRLPNAKLITLTT